MLYGPHYLQSVNRVQPVDADPGDDDARENRKRRVLYQGRAWNESEEELPVQLASPKIEPPKPRAEKAPTYFADPHLFERAQAFFAQLTTLEEKVAQLCFLTTQAVYNTALQRDVEMLIQTCQIGGVLFTKGEYKRQAYLIERFQEITKTPLLIANDFLHGLSFYLQGDSFKVEALSEPYLSDLGKAVMAQNRRLGVHVQFDRSRDDPSRLMSEKQAQAFRQGIRRALGIVGKEKTDKQQEGGYGYSIKNSLFPPGVPKNAPQLSSIFTSYQVQETIGFKTLTFFDATELPSDEWELEFLQAIEQHYDVILLPGQTDQAIELLAALVRAGKIREEVIDRHVMKVLLIKMLYFNR